MINVRFRLRGFFGRSARCRLLRATNLDAALGGGGRARGHTAATSTDRIAKE
jgi:hypothetical protein